MIGPESLVKVSFSLSGEEFPLEEVTRTLGLAPTETYEYGDVVTNKPETQPRYHKETVWKIETEYEKSFNVKEQLDKVLQPLLNKTEEINEIKEKYSVECLIMIILIMEKGETPAMYLDKESIDFASRIGSEIHWDLYANPYVSDY